MFNKPTFGATTSSFGPSSFNTSATPTASPFGGFKPATNTAFGGPPAFGTPAQPSTTGGLFGSSNTTGGGLFGGSQPSGAPAFGAPSTGFGFGAATSTNVGGGLFGASNTNTGLFGQNQNANAFGAKPAGFGFGSTATTGTSGGLFGSTAQPASSGLFGQQTNTMGGGGLFNSHGAFGQQQGASGTAHAKYNPVVGTDTIVKSGTTQNINIKHHCITCMKEYESKSIEELRFEDYSAGRKGSTTGTFGGFQPTAEAKPLFGGSSAFGQPAATTAPSVFGGGGLGNTTGFGQTSTFSFGQNAQNTTNTTGLFGAAKPAFGATPSTGTSLFGATTTQAPTFGTATPSFGFGSTAQNQTSGSLFGGKPATTGFGVSQPTSAFGGFGTGTSMFGAKPAQSAAPAFGTATPAFGGLNTSAFGATTSTAGNLFGGSAFGKPAGSQPAFGFGAPNTGLSTGLGTNTFQTKPAEPAFGGLGGSLFNNPASNNFNSGLGNTSLGGGMFGGNTSLGGSALGGMGGLGNTSFTNANLGASAAGNVHEQILNLVARPYGDSPLFKDMVPDASTTAEDALKPTNPSAVKAVLDGSAYRVTSPTTRLRVNTRPCLTHDKKSLFDGLEESDASLEDKLSLKPSRKRLVLRPKSHIDDRNGAVDNNPNRSLDEPTTRQTNGPSKDAVDSANQSESENRARKNSFADSNNLENSSDRRGSWLNASKHNWSAEKEKPIDGPTPRIYPSLDKEAPIHISERRASWLTTKALRKPMSSNPEIAENSVRELAVRLDRSQDKENIDTFYVSREEENVPVQPREMPPHPTGVKLTRPGYYILPTLDDMLKHMRPDGSCVVPHLTIGRKNYGNVYYDCEIDVAGLDLDDLVHFMNKEVTIYPDDSNKPPVGQGLNRRAIVTLDRIWPRDKTDKKPITDPERLISMDYEGKLRRACDKHDTKFIEYRPQTGSWVFRVEHFSKYSLTDSDEDDEITPDILKRQLVNQQLQKAAVTAPPRPPASAAPAPGLGGFGSPPKSGLNQLPFTPASPVLTTPAYPAPTGVYGPPGPSYATAAGTGPGLNMSGGVTFAGINSDLLAMQQTSLTLLHSAGKAFEMDTTEDNGESQSLYQDRDRAFGVKSPTSELARLENRHSHNVQLMKASLYADSEMADDDVSMSTGDQMVPRGTSLHAPAVPAHETRAQHATADIHHPAVTPHTDEVKMKPLVIRPHTIVLKHHRKVPPFKRTIAGLRDASLLADMSVCRSRHSRVGFGVRGALVFPTSYDCITPLPKEAELCDLKQYVRGRGADDWSESVVARLAMGQPDNVGTQETLARHLETLLEYSTLTDCGADQSRRLQLKDSPKDRRLLLLALQRNYNKTTHQQRFGVSSSYCREVFTLCDALWGADLDNDGLPGTDELSIVNRHRRLLEWLTEAVKDITEHELSTPAKGEPEDEEDGHSGRVWTLMLGGRVLEAARAAREAGDLNMAALISQASGDPAFRSLLARQLSQWQECGAAGLVSSARLASLYLLAGLSTHRERLMQADWLRAFHATARYLCNHVPSLEVVVRKFESLLTGHEYDAETEVDLSVAAVDTQAPRPLPPYLDNGDISDQEPTRRVLDLRYELIRARALNLAPRLQPASYTPDPMDCSLCFILGVWFGNPSVSSITGMADQLEASGDYHLAIQALAYLPDNKMRAHLIQAVLSRHVPAKSDTPEHTQRLALLERLLPKQWIMMARATRAKYEHLPMLETKYLIGAEQWNAAHTVLLDELLPEAVLADDLQSIAPLLEKLNEAAQRHEVSGWQSGGLALHHYIHVCDEIRGLVSTAEADGDRAAMQSKLEALRPRVAAACTALGRLQAKTERHSAARTEMGVRLVQLAVCAGGGGGALARLLRTLALPPDCTVHAHRKITQDLAEQASELCIESASSSPISSQRPTTVQS